MLSFFLFIFGLISIHVEICSTSFLFASSSTIPQTTKYKFGSFKGLSPSKISSTKKDRVNLGTLDVSAVGVGTISWFSGKDRSGAGNSVSDLNEVMTEAARSGCNLFDTAERYGSGKSEALGQGWGTSESFLSSYISNDKKGDLRIATKFTPTPWRRTAQDVVTACEDSCARLGVESIDLYQVHMPDIVQPFRIFGIVENKDAIYWDGLAECYKRGLVKNVGVSNYGPSLLLKASEHLSRAGVPLVSNQINYSLLHRSGGTGAQETVDIGKALGITTLAYFPLAMGLLSGKHSANPTHPSGKITNSATVNVATDDLSAVGRETGKSALELRELRDGRYAAAVMPLLAVMQEIARRRRKSIPQIALNWIMCKGAVPIAGVRTAAQLRDNLGARGWRLAAEEVARLEEAADRSGVVFDGAGFKRSSAKFVGYGMEKWSLD
mmetsp:Transcript_9811/g.16176  ORF Transcript_9811/g.16176 Transcript_9811/m.16176 type:complete len:438 (+) Transcript_9811:28-1341(+)